MSDPRRGLSDDDRNRVQLAADAEERDRDTMPTSLLVRALARHVEHALGRIARLEAVAHEPVAIPIGEVQASLATLEERVRRIEGLAHGHADMPLVNPDDYRPRAPEAAPRPSAEPRTPEPESESNG